MLIRLKSLTPTEGAAGAKHLPAETVTVACPDHLVLADLPVAKGTGAVTTTTLVKNVGCRSRRQLGERVHFCVSCDFPIAIYGRLSPCEHAFCLECARSYSISYLCDERIQKIQTIKMMEGIFVCAAPHCLKSFLKRGEFESHIHENHAYLLQPNAGKMDGNESESWNSKQCTVSESTACVPPRPLVSPGSNSQLYDREDKAQLQQTREQSLPRPVMQPNPAPDFGQVQNNPPDPSRPPGFDRPAPHSLFHQQSYDSMGAPMQESGQFSDKQQGILSETPFSEYPPMHSIPPPNYAIPVNSNQVRMPLPFGFPFLVDGSQQVCGAPYEMARQDSAPDVGPEQGLLLGFAPGSVGNMNFPAGYPESWNAGQAGVPFEAAAGGQGNADSFSNSAEPQGQAAFYQGEYGRNLGGMPFNSLQMTSTAMEQVQGGNIMDPMDGKGVLAAQPMSLPPPPPPPPHITTQTLCPRKAPRQH